MDLIERLSEYTQGLKLSYQSMTIDTQYMKLDPKAIYENVIKKKLVSNYYPLIESKLEIENINDELNTLRGKKCFECAICVLSENEYNQLMKDLNEARKFIDEIINFL